MDLEQQEQVIEDSMIHLGKIVGGLVVFAGMLVVILFLVSLI
jgi:hypothetical protein